MLIVVDVFLNLAPVADAGQDRTVRPGASVTLDGSGSHDPDGTIASFEWGNPDRQREPAALDVSLA